MSNSSAAAEFLADGVVGAILLVILIILGAGLIGGWAAYLTQLEDAPPAESPRPQPSVRRFCVLGVIASACVPLFLSLVQSKLLESAFKPAPESFIAFLVFAGLCLIAAFSARSFIDSISRRVLQQVEQIKERQAEVEQQVAVNKEKIDSTAETVDEQEARPASGDEDHTESALLSESAPALNEQEKRIVAALARKSFRTVSGITEDSELARNTVQWVLRDLAKKHLAEPTTSPKSGGLRWMITPLGKAALRV